jgi:autotransporter-associated beta strand protein
MKKYDPKSKNSGLFVLIALMAFGVMLPSVQAQDRIRTWSGAGANASWKTAENWTANSTLQDSVSSNAINIAIFGSATNQLTNYTEHNPLLLKELKFNADADSDVSVRLSTAATTSRNVYFGDSFLGGLITVEAGSTGNFLIGATAYGTVFLNNDLTVAHNGDGDLTITRPIVRSNGGGGTLLGDVPANVGIIKTGTGKLILSGANTYNGGTTITEGYLIASNNTALGSGRLTMNGGTLGNSGGARTLTTPANLQAAVSFVDTTGGSLTFSGAITNSGGLVKIGTGTLTLSGANTYSGDTTVSNGTLSIRSGSAISNSVLRISDGAIVNLTNSVNAVTQRLYLGTESQKAGVYGSTSSMAQNKNDTYFVGSGTLEVLNSGPPRGTVLIIQ